MTTNKRYWLVWITFLAVVMCLIPAGGQGAQSTDSLQALYEAAKAEGEVSFWGSTDPEEMGLLAEGFNRRFPGIKVKPFEITPGQAVQRIVQEAQVGKISVDATESSISTMLPLLERDLVQGYDDWAYIFQGLNFDHQKNVLGNKAVTWYNLAHPIAYNTRLLKLEDVPKTWEELLDPKWKGRKIIVEARAKTFAYLGLKWGEKKMEDYVRGIAAQKPVFSKGGTNVIQQLSAGEAPLALGTYAYKVMWYARDKKAPIDFIDTTSPMGASYFTVFALKGAKHPNAARLFTGWLATPEALKILEDISVKGSLLPGSTSPVYKRLKKNNVELVFETAETAVKRGELEKKASKALGAIR